HAAAAGESLCVSDRKAAASEGPAAMDAGRAGRVAPRRRRGRASVLDPQMSFERHRQDWEHLAEIDPLWAVLTVPGRKGGRWGVDGVFASGETGGGALGVT